MNTTTTELDQQAKNEIAASNARAAKRRDQELKLGQLTKAVTTAEQNLVELESKKSFLQQRKSQLQDQLLQLWPKQASDLSLQPNSSPIQLVVESHGTILAIDSALSDVVRARKHLDQQLQIAKAALTEFQKK